MKALVRAIVLGVGLTGLLCGCAVFVRRDSRANYNVLRDNPPQSVAILPFENQSDQPLAGAAARDALFYALVDRGYEPIAPLEIDRKLADPANARRLRKSDGQVDTRAAGSLFGADAVVLGRISQADPTNARVITLTRVDAQIWMFQAETERLVWTEKASGWVRLFPELGSDNAVTPAEAQQGELLRLCRAFDELWWKLRTTLPSAAPSPGPAPVEVRKVTVSPTRPVVSAGDRIDIAIEGTPGCLAHAQLGTLGKEIALEEIAEAAAGLYRGAYTVELGDISNYCRPIITLEAGAAIRRKIADPGSAFVIDTIAPDPPTSLTYETNLEGVEIAWAPPRNHDLAHYMVYRGDEVTGGVRLLGRPVESRFLDGSIQAGGRFHYFVKSVDRAGNPSAPSGELMVTMPGRGPSSVGGTVTGEQRLSAFSGPYRLTEDIDVVPGARLIIEPGTTIDIPPGTEITVRGAVEAIGREGEPIRLVGNEATAGFHLIGDEASLHAAHTRISGTGTAIRVEKGGTCFLDQVTLDGNGAGLDAHEAEYLSVSNSTLSDNAHGAAVGPAAELLSCNFDNNQVGLQIFGDGLRLETCRFDNIRLDIVKSGLEELAVDDCQFWTADPALLYMRLWGNVTCSEIIGPALVGGTTRIVFDPPERAQARAELAAVEAQWEKALAAYKEVLIQNRDRDLIDKALKMYKQIADLEGAEALDREIRFCRSAVLCYPYDVALLSHLAELYFQTGQGSMGRTLCAQVLEIDPENEYAKKRLEAAAPTL